ncbi:MAG: chitobiase/beta-hexosaminidase C-terminal domain-containing protein, partial [Oscillospiraceae bacterium]|nr:chitobiase/beta-hexosaminidase C-terminal domain-containing protein [Oscillospiraceae bacterium]
MLRKMIGLFMAAVLCFSILPASSYALEYGWTTGNSDLNIQNGGVMLQDGEDFYFVQDGLFVRSGEEVRALSPDNARNLNLYDGYIYYTIGRQVRRVPSRGGSVEEAFEADSEISQLYVVNGSFLFLSGGEAFERINKDADQIKIEALAGVKKLIPTRYGNLMLTGEIFDYTLWANDTRLMDGVTSCYTDGDYLAVQIGNENYMASLEKLFKGFYPSSDMLDFDIHGTVPLGWLLAPDDEASVSAYSENNELACDFKALLYEAGFTDDKVTLMENDTDSAAAVIPPVSDGQRNIVKRARQLTEIQWTPLEDITQWGYYGVFKAETTYTGIPYGQPVNANGYIGYGVSLESFASAVLDNTSRFYTSYSSYNKIAPVYSTDCSGYVSYAWGLAKRKTTYSLTEVAEIVGDQSIYSLQVGDCLDKETSHTVLISNLTYDTNGNIIGVQTMEETPVITRVTDYGAGQTRSLASFQSYYLSNGYVIYRNPQRDSVTYTPSPAVPLDGETVPGQKEAAPKSRTTSFVGGKSVSLTSDTPGTAIYYTLDGSSPTASSRPYSAPLTFSETTKLRAIAVSGNFDGSAILEYTVKVPQIAAPAITVASGLNSGSLVSSGSQIKLGSVSGATIYYTLDGTDPTSSSMAYSSPITLTQDTTIKAIAEAPGMKRSETATAAYRVGAVYTVTASAGAGGSISPQGTSSILSTGSKTFTISPDAGYAVSDILVDGVSVGAVTNYTLSNINSNHTITASFKYTAQIPFTDVSSDQWFSDAVSFVYAKGLYNGTSPTAFSPEMTMTRGMFVTVLGRFAGLPSDLTSGIGLVTGTGVNIRSGPSTDTEVAGFISNKNTAVQVTSVSGDWYGVKYAAVTGYIRKDLIKVYSGSYSDLTPGLYYSPYAEWAALTGIAGGVAGTTFAAETSITREHMCMLLYNYAAFSGKTLPVSTEKSAFTDDSSISSGARTAVYALQQAGIING